MLFPRYEEILEFVHHSNAIEEILVLDNHPLVLDHLAAINYALRAVGIDRLPEPLDIHRILLSSELRKYPGRYRFREVAVDGKKVFVSYYMVPIRMIDLLELVRKGPDAEEDVEEWVWKTHAEFEYIHPFLDGNGRTGRILMNAIRLLYNLPWLTITVEEKQDYFRKIRSYKPSWVKEK